MNFRELGLIDPILKALDQAGYTQPTPIQQGAIPPALAGRDVLGCAQTGTGKTCAFSTPILQRLNEGPRQPRGIRALILTPTRELAIQIGESFSAYGRNLPLRHAVIFGGVGQQPQVDKIKRGLDILVATPGRLLDIQGQGLLDLSHIEIFVLDEADRMLDMGFIHDVKRVIKLLPREKQTLFFSATMPPEVMDLVNSLLHDYARVEVDPVSSPVEVIRQSLYYVDKGNKTKLLAHLIEEMGIPSALVFSRTKHGANRIAQDLEKRGISAAAIHGNKSQTARVQALKEFKSGKIRVLVATDIAARGIDIEELPYVFNYNLPDMPETYVHRIGRTGRAGHEGTAISFCQFDEKDELRAIEKLLGKPLPVVEEHPYPMVDLTPPQKDRHGRPVNAEDAEARAAAKERRRARDAENKARAEARKLSAAQTPAAENKPAERAPAKKETGNKKNNGRAAQESSRRPEPTQTGAARDVGASRPRTAPARGVRQGKLEDTLPADPSMPMTDFYKPNPLDSDVIMDATARLLAPRRTGAASARTQSERKPARKEQQHRGGKTGGENRRPPQQKKAAQSTENHEKAVRPDKKQSAQPQQEPRQEQAPAKKKKRRRNDRPRPMERSLYARQKDSTEQHSLMRPYYLSDED